MAGKRGKRPKPEPPPEPPPPPPAPAVGAGPGPGRAATATALKVLLGLGLAGGAVAGLAWVGQQAGLGVVGRGRYAVRVADISCETPPGTDRAAFLTEVRYLGNLPETVQTVDPDLPARLSAAFVAHPWVAATDGVTVRPDQAVRVSLRFRVPVLAVSVVDEPTPRAVDAAGVLLPPTASTDGLATFVPAVPPPTVPAGKPWPDADVVRGAELAAEFRATRVEKTPGFWRVTKPDGAVLRVGW